eukprot:TRINITY_DN465_c0_g1_i1.p1 TRINITY_DN465_c0_g1~~TRINITY_DN465_c0_g1_i1.p1  ORF type:complete len:197 (-),score=42.90 TRINITY_DN465_c0_g1_i1:96-686(-)
MAFTARTKIVKLPGHPVTDYEDQIAQHIFDLQSNANDSLKTELKPLYFHSAREFRVNENKKAVVIAVPFRQLKDWHRIHSRLVQELEKKISGKHVVIIAQRTYLPKQTHKSQKKTQKRPYSRTIKVVHDAILEDLVYPVEIVGKRVRCRMDGSRLIKVHLDPKEQANVQSRIDTFAAVYKKLTGKRAEFLFPDYRL